MVAQSAQAVWLAVPPSRLAAPRTTNWARRGRSWIAQNGLWARCDSGGGALTRFAREVREGNARGRDAARSRNSRFCRAPEVMLSDLPCCEREG